MYIARACMYTTCICADCQDEESEERSLKMMDVQGYDSEKRLRVKSARYMKAGH